jgi:multimeric flavodoxin WrbA
MAVKTLGISASPRLGGNTDVLLRRALDGAGQAGSEIEYLRLCEYRFEGCTECETCRTVGSCAIDDDYGPIQEKMLAADRLVFATPVFFMTVSGQAKLLIDRAQCLWVRKAVLGRRVIDPPRDRRGMIIAAGGSGGRRQFECIRCTVQSWFDCLEVSLVSSLFVNRVDEKDAVLKRPEALEEAFRLGRELAGSAEPVPEKPVRVELA